MNHSLLTADRRTHFKIVAVALLAALVIVVAGVSARVSDSGSTAARGSATTVVKAGKPPVYSTRDTAVIH